MTTRTAAFFILALAGAISAGESGAQVLLAEGANNITALTVARNAADEPMLQINIENPSGQPDAQITAVTIRAAGSGDDSADVVGVRLFWDRDRNGRLTTGGMTPDLLLGSGAFAGDNGTATFSNFPEPVVVPGSGTLAQRQADLLVIYDLGGGATVGESFQARLAQAGDITIVRADNQQPVTTTGAPVNGFTRTVGAGRVSIVRLEQNPDGAVAIPNRLRLPVFNFTLSAEDVEPISIAGFQFTDIESGNLATSILPGSVRLFQQDGIPNDTHMPIASGSFSADNGTVVLRPSAAFVLGRGETKEFWVTLDMPNAAGGQIGSTIRLRIPQGGEFDGIGQTSQLPPTVTGGNVNGPAWEFNFNPLNFASPSDAGAVLMPGNAVRYPIFSFEVQNDPTARSEIVNVRSFRFHADGTMNDGSAVSAVELFRDRGRRGIWDEADLLVGSSSLTGDNGTVTIALSEPFDIGLGGREHFLVAYTMTGTATDGQTARLSLLTRDDMQIVGAISQENGSLIPTPFRGATKTIGRPRAELTLETNLKRIPDVVAPGNANPPDPNAIEFPLAGFVVKNLNDERLEMRGVRLHFRGSGDETAYFQEFALWFDSDGNGEQHDTNDFEISRGTMVAMGGDGYLEFQPDAETDGDTIEVNQTRRYTLYARVSPSVLGDGSETFSIDLDGDDALILEGLTSTAGADFTTPIPPVSLARTIRNPSIELDGYPDPEQLLGCINGNYGMIGMVFDVPSGEDMLVERIRFQMGGSLDDPPFIEFAAAWNDTNRNLFVDTSEFGRDFGYHAWPNPVSADNGIGTIEFQRPDGAGGFVPEPGLVERASDDFEISTGVGFAALDPAVAQAQLGRNATVFQSGSMVIEGRGARSGRPIEVVNPAGADQGITITFDNGDIEVRQFDITRVSAPPGCPDVEAFALRFLTDVIEDVRIDELRLTPLGTLDESLHIRPGGVRLFVDGDRNGILSALDFSWAVAEPPATDNGPIVFSPATAQYVPGIENTLYSFPPGARAYDQLLLLIDLLPSAPEGSTLQFQIADSSHIRTTGACSLLPYGIGTLQTYDPSPPILGPAVTIMRGAVDFQMQSNFLNENDPETVMAPTAQDYTVIEFNARATTAEEVMLTGFTIRSTGAAHEVNAINPIPPPMNMTGGVRLYRNAVSANNLLAEGVFSGDDGSVTFADFTPLVLRDNASERLLVTFSGSGAGAFGQDFNLSIAGADLMATGVCSELPITRIVPADPFVPPVVRFNPGTLTVRGEGLDANILPLTVVDGIAIQNLRLTASRTEEIVLEDMTIAASGTADETTALDNSALLVNFRQSSTSAPMLISSAPFDMNDGIAQLRDLDIVLGARSNTNRYSLDVELDPARTIVGSTLRFDVTNNMAIRGVGSLTGAEVFVVLEDGTGGDNIAPAETITGRNVTLTTGIVTVNRGSDNPSDATIMGNETSLSLSQIRLRVTRDLEGVTVQESTMCWLGSGDPTQIVGPVRLVADSDSDGEATPADVQLGSATFQANLSGGFELRYSNLQTTLPEDADVEWVFAADLTGAGVAGNTIQIGPCSETPVVAGTGQLTQLPLNLVIQNPPPQGARYTIGGPTPTPTPVPTSGTPTPTPSRTPTPQPTITPSPTPTPIAAILGNISTRGFVGNESEVMIAGVIVGGTTPRRVLVSGIGPTLSGPPFNVPGAIGNPQLTLLQGPAVLQANDNWMDSPVATDIMATGLAPGNALEPALLAVLNPGEYTAILSGVAAETGVGLVQAFDLDSGSGGAGGRLVNISTRLTVGTGERIMIGGFIVDGDSPKPLVIRALGPTLAAPPFNIPGTLADPELSILSGQDVIAANANWMDDPAAGEVSARGFAPSNASEAALYRVLPPGAYTAFVSGAAGGAGVALIEVYDAD